MKVEEYLERLRERVGEGEYERHKELVHLLARNLVLEDILWEELLVSLRDADKRADLLKQRNTVINNIHQEFKALNIEVPTVVEKNTEGFILKSKRSPWAETLRTFPVMQTYCPLITRSCPAPRP